MKLNYNITGTERKSLVGAISQELNAPTKYLGAPTFAYEVGEYTIDKTGTVTGRDNLDLEDALHQRGFDAEEREYDEPDTYESGLGGMGAVDVFETEERRESDIPDQHTYRAELSDPDTPERMEVFSANNDEDALRQAFGYCEGEIRLLELHELDGDYNEVRSVEIAPDHLIIALPKGDYSETVIANLEKLVSSKAALIKKAIGADSLPIAQTEDTLEFPWFRFTTDADEVSAYSKFIAALCKMAKEQKRVTAKEKSVDNEKYAFRCFLLRLGFIGDDFKIERKILLANLSGNGSFKNGQRKQSEEPTGEGEAHTLAEALADE